MTSQALAAMVKHMRDLQKRYFRDPAPELLRHCRDMERRVDKAVKECLDDQPSLFPDDPAQEGKR